MALTTTANVYGFGIQRAVAQVPKMGLSATFAETPQTITVTAHGLQVGDVVVFTTITSTTGVTTATVYYVVEAATDTFKIATTPGGTAVTFTGDGSGTLNAIKHVRLRYANNIVENATTSETTWEGDNETRTINTTTGYSLDISADCLTLNARKEIFNPTIVTSSLPDGFEVGQYSGSSQDLRPVTIGLYVESSGQMEDPATGVTQDVILRRWYPSGTLTYVKAPDKTTSAKFGMDQYQFAPNKTSTDIIGVALPSVPAGGTYAVDLARQA